MYSVVKERERGFDRCSVCTYILAWHKITYPGLYLSNSVSKLDWTWSEDGT